MAQSKTMPIPNSAKYDSAKINIANANSAKINIANSANPNIANQ